MIDLPNALPGPKILIQGDSGAGKTFALGPLADWAERSGLEMFVLFTENGLETLLGYWRDHPRLPPRPVPACLHWHVVPSPAISLDSLTKAANLVGLLAYEALTKSTDPNRGGANNPYERILKSLADFPDDRTGKTFGNIGTWTNKRILVVDSLSELANACFKMVIGSRPTAAPPDYGVSQNNLMNLLRYFTQGFPPTFVLTAHLSRQKNELTGGEQLMTKAIGKAMGDDIPQLFSEVLYARRDGIEWVWDTAASNVSTKTRYLPISSKIPPDLGVVMDKWVKRGAVG